MVDSIIKVSDKRGESPSEFIRIAVSEYLKKNQKLLIEQ